MQNKKKWRKIISNKRFLASNGVWFKCNLAFFVKINAGFVVLGPGLGGLCNYI